MSSLRHNLLKQFKLSIFSTASFSKSSFFQKFKSFLIDILCKFPLNSFFSKLTLMIYMPSFFLKLVSAIIATSELKNILWYADSNKMRFLDSGIWGFPQEISFNLKKIQIQFIFAKIKKFNDVFFFEHSINFKKTLKIHEISQGKKASS